MHIEKDYIMEFINNNYQDIYLNLLFAHYNDFEYKNSPRGGSQRERICTHFTLSNPIERVVYSNERRANIIFQYAEAIWYLSGDNSLDFIGYYAPRMSDFSQDGKVLTGTAYGHKIFSYNNVINQWKYIVNELRRDPDSRRCIISIYGPEEASINNNIDMSCTISLQFLLRENKLNMITTMRSNDIYLGGVTDVFSFTILQEVLARELGTELGCYYHQIGSSHLYEKNYIKAELILKNKKTFAQYGLSFPQMPEGNNWPYIYEVIALEEKIRHDGSECFKDIVKQKRKLPKYWRDVVSLFEIYAIHRDNGVSEINDKLEMELFYSLNKTLQYLVKLLYKYVD